MPTYTCRQLGGADPNAVACRFRASFEKFGTKFLGIRTQECAGALGSGAAGGDGCAACAGHAATPHEQLLGSFTSLTVDSAAAGASDWFADTHDGAMPPVDLRHFELEVRRTRVAQGGDPLLSLRGPWARAAQRGAAVVWC